MEEKKRQKMYNNKNNIIYSSGLSKQSVVVN